MKFWVRHCLYSFHFITRTLLSSELNKASLRRLTNIVLLLK